MHSKVLEKMLKEAAPDRKVFFVYGGVPGDERENIRKIMERTSKTVKLKLGDIEKEVPRAANVTLSNGTIKKAYEISIGDDVSDEWINS